MLRSTSDRRPIGADVGIVDRDVQWDAFAAWNPGEAPRGRHCGRLGCRDDCVEARGACLQSRVS